MTRPILAAPRANGRSVALVLTIATHVSLAALWISCSTPLLPNDTQPARVTVLTLLPAHAAPASPRPPASLAMPQARRAHELRLVPLPTLAIEADTPTPTPPASVAVDPATAPDLATEPLRQVALRSVGKIARELQPHGAGNNAIEPAPLRMARFMESAHVDRSLGTRLERHVSPDGVVVTRVGRNGGVVCYMSGTVNFVPGILHDSARPQTVNCPHEKDGWSRE